MSISRSLEIGVAGLRANSEALGVAGDNIANVNTVGFKRSRGEFQDMVGGSITGLATSAAAGAGSRLAYVDQVWSQGAIVTTDSPTDLALSGDGFFVVDGTVSGVTGRFYTRAGQFKIDEQGRLVNSDGLRLQGYMALPNGTLSPAITDLVVNAGTVPASATQNVTIAANLDANEDIIAGGFLDTDPAGTSNFSNTVTVYDSLGNAHEVTVYYTKTASNEWSWNAMVDGGDLTGGTAGVAQVCASGSLTFTTDGALDTETLGASSFDFLNATAAQNIVLDFGTSITTDAADGGTGLDGTTQFGSRSTVTGLSQDGFAAGSVDAISISSDGTITGVFTNGQQRRLGQVVIANFASVAGLNRTGQGLWAETVDSGQALIGAAESGGRGSVVSGALEQSNVDLANEFVNLILYQRGFQANSRVVTTSDEVYQELVNIKR
jgi:flagellar hook protein FlgE